MTISNQISWAKVGINTLGRDFVVGDIHGEFDKVDELLLKVKFDEEKDRLFALGDLIDRGDQNEDVLKWLAQPWFFSILGNHEQMILGACAGPDEERASYAKMHYINGGEWFYKLDAGKQQEIFAALAQLPVLMEIETATGLVGLVHADVPGFDWKDVKENIRTLERSVDSALWGRDRIRRQITQEVLGVDTVYVGHSPVKFTHRLGNVQFVDTGACFPNGHMTMIQIDTGEVWIVK